MEGQVADPMIEAKSSSIFINLGWPVWGGRMFQILDTATLLRLLDASPEANPTLTALKLISYSVVISWTQRFAD